MNCNTCRYELSQCLDGRLPTGRRALVLAHAESCDACGPFWSELQAAQKLTLSLRSSEVSADFREGLWERIHAGEGTPDAVFAEPVATWTKVRYALTGAAAAAALLLGVSLFRPAPSAAPESAETETASASAGNEVVLANGSGLVERAHDYAPMHLGHPTTTYTQNTLLSNARPLTLQVLAQEAASQLEQHYQQASLGMRMMRDPSLNRDAAMRQVIDNAHELLDVGELLIDLRQRDRLVFTDDQVDRDLNFAVEWLDRVPEGHERSPEAVEDLYGPALSKRRLGSVKDHIGLRLASDPAREVLELMELNTRRPGVFPKLFFVFGDMPDLESQLSNLPHRMVFVGGACGPSWVAPRSEVTRHETRLRIFERLQAEAVEIEVRQGR